MKKLLILFLLFPLLIKAQRTEWDIAFQKSIPDSLGKPVNLPARDYNPNFSINENFSYRQKKRVFVISSDSVYRKLFWRYIYTDDSLKKYKNSKIDSWSYNWFVKHHVDSLPVIDFSENELVMYSSCAQCLAFCSHYEGQEPCHRNACNFREAWLLRKRKE